MDINTFTLFSNDLGGNFTLLQSYTEAGGNNMSPQLNWINAPKKTESFAITMYDQSAATGGGFWHWLMFDIPTKIMSIPADSGNVDKNLLPPHIIQSINDYGYYGYGGPNPPKGDGNHLYLITIYAIDIPHLGLVKDSMPNYVGFNLWKHTIEKASLVAYFRI